ncbi:MAG: DUF4402 domain-containing protein [Alphaproteobacteria bacterium]|nr:DUF4402 domain-containing protein [Alphaproteobacteria bacterium]
MNKTRKGLSTQKALLTGAAVISLGAGVVPEAQAVTATGGMSAIVLTPITVTATQVLHFGSFTRGAGGTVKVTTAGARTVTGPTAVTGAAAEQQGVLKITGAPTATVNVKVTATNFSVTSGPNTMVVNAFNLKTAAGGTSVTAAIGPTATPTVQVPIGGTLTVGAAQAAGTYTGAYKVDVNYP